MGALMIDANANRSWVIYTLADPRDGGVRYVGVTHKKVEQRLAGHLYNARRKDSQRYHTYNWIRNLLADGVTPLATVIDSGVGGSWGDTETKWIRYYRDHDCRLTNATDGGEGAVGHTVSEEARARIRAARLGKPLSEEHKAKVAKGNTGKKMSPEAIAKTAAFWRGRTHTQETKEKISTSMVGKPGHKPSSDTIAKRVAAIKAKIADPNWVDPRVGRPMSEDHKAKIAAGNLGKKRSIEVRKRMSDAKMARDVAQKESHA